MATFRHWDQANKIFTRLLWWILSFKNGIRKSGSISNLILKSWRPQTLLHYQQEKKEEKKQSRQGRGGGSRQGGWRFVAGKSMKCFGPEFKQLKILYKSTYGVSECDDIVLRNTTSPGSLTDVLTGTRVISWVTEPPTSAGSTDVSIERDHDGRSCSFRRKAIHHS